VPFPSLGATVPTLAPFQFSFLGYTFGGLADPMQIQKIEGLDVGSVRSGDAGRARDAGRFVGLDLLDGRDITITADVLLTLANWQRLAAVILPGGIVESPLWFGLPGWGTMACMARVRKHSAPIDIQSALSTLTNITIQFSASDPRLYLAPTLGPSVGLPNPTAGFSFPLRFNLGFGGGASSVGVLQAVNTGNIESRPLLLVTGPCTTPTIQNQSAPGAPYVSFAVTMAAGDTMLIDTDMHTATYYVAGTTIGAPRAAFLQPGSSWWTLLPAGVANSVPGGVNTIAFSSQDQTQVAGTLQVQYASAWIL